MEIIKKIINLFIKKEKEKEIKSRFSFMSVGEYDVLSIANKIKYHKMKGEKAEQLKQNEPICFKVIDKFQRLYMELEEESAFYISGMIKILKKHNFRDPYRPNELCYKLEDGTELIIRAFDGTIPFVVFEKKGEIKTLATITGWDNVISFKTDQYREQILKSIDKLYEK